MVCKTNKNMGFLKRNVKYIFTYALVMGILFLLLVLAAGLPKAYIKENVRESAEYLCERRVFFKKLPGIEGSNIDRYADSILLGIAYQYDSEHPLKSVMWSAYYDNPRANVNENLLEAVDKGLSANQQYMRYWHGSIAFVRPLLMLFSIKQIYVLNAISLILLTGLLLVRFVMKKAYAPAIGVALGLIAASAWFVPFSLEYTWTFILMLLASIAATELAYRESYKEVAFVFWVSGCVTCFMDFLTTETLTLTLPLLLVLWLRDRDGGQGGVKACIKYTILWLAGYVLTWLTKWLLAAIILKQDVSDFIMGNVAERLGLDTGTFDFEIIAGAVWKNISCLFPLEYGVSGAVIGIGIILVVACKGYVYHQENIDKKKIMLYAFVGIIPYIRYMLISNHSYMHFFFTYRAQLATVLAVALILEECRRNENIG